LLSEIKTNDLFTGVAGLDRKQEENVNKCILLMKQPSLFWEG
jgi:hypothetical protein